MYDLGSDSGAFANLGDAEPTRRGTPAYRLQAVRLDGTRTWLGSGTPAVAESSSG